MNDEELIRWLRNLEPMDYELRHGTFQAAAANRIEALVTDLKNAVDVLREILFTSNEDHTGNWLDALARGQAFLTRLDMIYLEMDKSK